MHTANQPYNVLDGASKEKNPRSASDLARLNRYAPVLRSYCAAGDPVCAGGNVVADHLNYFELYTDDASSWVVSKINNVAPLPSCGASSSAVPIPTASVSATSVINTPTASVSATSVINTPTATVSATWVGSAPAATASAAGYPTSPVVVSPFPRPIAYDTCVLNVHVEYCYE